MEDYSGIYDSWILAQADPCRSCVITRTCSSYRVLYLCLCDGCRKSLGKPCLELLLWLKKYILPTCFRRWEIVKQNESPSHRNQLLRRRVLLVGRHSFPIEIMIPVLRSASYKGLLRFRAASGCRRLWARRSPRVEFVIVWLQLPPKKKIRKFRREIEISSWRPTTRYDIHSSLLIHNSIVF